MNSAIRQTAERDGFELMRDLKDLGFRLPSTVRQDDGTIDVTGTQLPESFLRFLQFSPPPKMELGFRFTHPSSGDEWEGQIVEFMFYSDEELGKALCTVHAGQGGTLLPIAADAGGNYVYLDVSQSPMSVVSVVDSGDLVVIANSFDEFIDKLYVLNG
jgi:hypothetical protein